MIEQYTIDDIGPGRWDAFVRAHPHGSLYHLSAWHRVMRRSYGIETRYLVDRDEDGEILSGIPVARPRSLLVGRRNISYPFSDHCDPLVRDGAGLEEMIEYLSGQSDPFEIRACRLEDEIIGIPVDRSFSNYSIPLGLGLEALYSRLHSSSVRRRIERAGKAGVEVTECGSEDGLRRYYRLHLATRRRLGLPSQPLLFFQRLREEFGASGDFKILLAEYQGRDIGGQVLIRHRREAGGSPSGGTMFYKYGASDAAFFKLGFNPLLFWRAIKLAAELGCNSLDLGRASESGEPGLALFKSRLGAEGTPLRYYSTAEAYSGAGDSRAARMAGRLLRIAPPVASRIAGRMFYRYLG